MCWKTGKLTQENITCVNILFCVVTERNNFIEMMPDKVLFIDKCSTETENFTGSFCYRWENRDAAASKSRAAVDRNLLRYETLATTHCLKGMKALEGCLKTHSYFLKVIIFFFFFFFHSESGLKYKGDGFFIWTWLFVESCLKYREFFSTSCY